MRISSFQGVIGNAFLFNTTVDALGLPEENGGASFSLRALVHFFSIKTFPPGDYRIPRPSVIYLSGTCLRAAQAGP